MAGIVSVAAVMLTAPSAAAVDPPATVTYKLTATAPVDTLVDYLHNGQHVLIHVIPPWTLTLQDRPAFGLYAVAGVANAPVYDVTITVDGNQGAICQGAVEVICNA